MKEKFLMDSGYISENDLRKMTDEESVNGGTDVTAIISAITAISALITWVSCPSSACTTSCK